MKFNIDDKVVLRNSTSFFVEDFNDIEGKIIKVASKGTCPYQVQFKKKARRWCKEEELELCDGKNV